MTSALATQRRNRTLRFTTFRVIKFVCSHAYPDTCFQLEFKFGNYLFLCCYCFFFLNSTLPSWMTLVVKKNLIKEEANTIFIWRDLLLLHTISHLLLMQWTRMWVSKLLFTSCCWIIYVTHLREYMKGNLSWHSFCDMTYDSVFTLRLTDILILWHVFHVFR